MRGGDFKALPAVRVLYVSRARGLHNACRKDRLLDTFPVKVKVEITRLLHITPYREHRQLKPQAILFNPIRIREVILANFRQDAETLNEREFIPSHDSKREAG